MLNARLPSNGTGGYRNGMQRGESRQRHFDLPVASAASYVVTPGRLLFMTKSHNVPSPTPLSAFMHTSVEGPDEVLAMGQSRLHQHEELPKRSNVLRTLLVRSVVCIPCIVQPPTRSVIVQASCMNRAAPKDDRDRIRCRPPPIPSMAQ